MNDDLLERRGGGGFKKRRILCARKRGQAVLGRLRADERRALPRGKRRLVRNLHEPPGLHEVLDRVLRKDFPLPDIDDIVCALIQIGRDVR